MARKTKERSTRAPAPRPARAAADAPIVVGMVASAGGLEAFKKFFQAMPSDSGMAFVLIPHLDPRRESLMAPLIAKYTKMPVSEAEEGERLTPNHVHVIPPNRYLALRGGVLRLTGPVPSGGAPSIDAFLRSLAADQEERAVCVVLSGTGTYGTLGLRAVKAAGGMAMVQAPRDAEYEQMPQSAAATGLADFVLPAAKLPDALMSFARHALLLAPAAADDVPAPQDLNAVIGLLRARTRFDFRFYRKGMLLRRVQRRMGLGRQSSMAAYIEHLRHQPEEVKLLAKDLLISVTTFFRDPEAYDVLATQVLPALIEGKAFDDPVRVWVPGCASGEEAYSIAMLVLEQIAAAGKQCPLQVFATDIDPGVLESARRGVFPEAIESDVGAQRLRRFFNHVDPHHYQVNKALRDAVTFAPQNLLSDAPFSRLDLVSCRNLLIYLEPQVQERVVALLHFSLNPRGYLVLGPSENLGRHADLFESISKKWRIFRRTGVVRRTRADFPVTDVDPLGAARPSAGGPGGTLEQLAQQMLIAEYAPAVVLTNRDYEALFYWGPTERYLQQRPGAPTRNLTALARDGLGPRVRAAVHKALRTGERVSLGGGRIKAGGRQVPVRVTARPVKLTRDGSEPLVLLAFQDDAPGPGEKAPKEPPRRRQEESMVGQLEQELKISREELQSTIEELESSNEELKASNEEVMSMNEELQSSNEELETSKEELQSVNEELATVNSQLQEKLAELEVANDDMANLLTSAEFAIVYLRDGGVVARFTPAATRLFRLIASDIGRPIADIARTFVDDELQLDIEAVMRDLVARDKEVTTAEGRWYIRRVSPYRTQDNRILGVVLAFYDVSPLKRAEQGLRDAAGALEEKVAQRTEALRGEIAERDRAESSARERQDELTRVYRLHTAGALAASVAHELNQPLAAIASYCEATLQALRAGATPSDKVVRNLEQALAQTQRAAGVIRDLRAFISQEDPASTSTDLNGIARAVKGMFSVEAHATHVQIVLDLAEELPPCLAARIPVEHVLVNLVKNGIDAIHGSGMSGGSVSISTRRTNGEAQVSVVDTGPGLGGEDALRAFDAFYSSKPRGLGMGLSVCRSIIGAYAGRIWADPPSGRGAVFHFTLPLA